MGGPRALTSDLRGRQRAVLWWTLAANATLMVGEAIGGVVFGSLALLADAAHMLSDVAGLAVALVAHSLISRPGSSRHSFGLQRAEVLGAQANGVILVATAAWIAYEATTRISDPSDVHGGGVLVVALLGLAVNVASAVLLNSVRGESANIRAALVHMLADAAGSVAAITAGVAVIVWGATVVDPAVSIVIASLVLWAAWRLLRETTHVLLEGTPAGLDPVRVAAAIVRHDGIAGVHHLHLWSLASDTPALSAHVVVDGEVSMHEAQQRGAAVRGTLAKEFGIEHCTLELECHVCDDADHE